MTDNITRCVCTKAVNSYFVQAELDAVYSYVRTAEDTYIIAELGNLFLAEHEFNEYFKIIEPNT